MIRKVIREDKDWVLRLAEKTYSGSRMGFNVKDASDSFDAVVENDKDHVLFIRGEKTFFLAIVDPFLCNYDTKDALMELMVGEGNSGLEPVKLIHMGMEWARSKGAQSLQITSITEHQFGERLMASFGAKKRIVYDIPLTGENHA